MKNFTNTAPFPTTGGAFLWHFIKRQGKAFSALAVFMLVWSVNEALYPYLLKLFINGIVDHPGDRQDIWSAIQMPFLLLVGAWVFMEICMRLFDVVVLYTAPKFRANMREAVVKYVKQHSLSYFTNNFSGTIATRIHDIPKSGDLIAENVLEHVVAITGAFICALIVLWFASPIFTVLMLTWAMVHMGVTFWFFDELTVRSKAHANSISRLNGRTVDFMTNMLSVRLFARTPYETRRLSRVQKHEIRMSQIRNWSFIKVNFIRGVAGVIFIVSSIYFLIKGWQENWITIGDFPMVAMLIFTMMGQVWHLGFSIQRLLREFGILNAGLALVRQPNEVVDHPDAKELVLTKGEIKVENLSFSYLKGKGLFKDLSLSIKAGESVGLVGFSGSGKTSFVNLLMRFFDRNGGKIMIDGQDIETVTQDSLRNAIAMIPQDPSLFHRTLLENIRYGKPTATMDEVIAAAKKAHCHDFIQDLENGYQTMVGERGLKLSGGQRQRIAIARAILKDAPVLVLDEATSALDSATERCIQESIKELMVGRTTIIVAHRLSTLSSVDRIIVFDKGQVVEQGPEKELLKNDGPFKQLWDLQHDGFLPEKREG